MTQSDFLQVNIPFTGFYYSSHDVMFDNWLEYEHEVLSQDYNASDEDCQKVSEAFYAMNWQAIHTQYAKDYCNAFFNEIERESGLSFDWQFKELWSPREYNFMTDKIDVLINKKDVLTMFKQVNRDTLNQVCEDRHTSCDGFCSFYSNDWVNDWPANVLEWDEIQLGTLIRAWLQLHFDDNDAMSGEGCFSAFDLMENWQGNGGADDCISADKEGSTKLFAIIDEIREVNHAATA